MSFAPANSTQAFLSDEFFFPENQEEKQRFLVNLIKEHVEAINLKDIGLYADQEVVNGQLWFRPNDANTYDRAIRKVIDLGGLNNFAVTTPQNVAHGITIDSNIVVTRLYGAATDPGTAFLPLPYVDGTGGGADIGLHMDGTNIILDGTTDYSAYTTAYAIVEFIQRT